MKFCRVTCFVSILLLLTCNLYPQEKPLKLEISIDSTVYYQGKEINLNITISRHAGNGYYGMFYELVNLNTNEKLKPAMLFHGQAAGVTKYNIWYESYPLKSLFITGGGDYSMFNPGKYSLHLFTLLLNKDTVFSNKIIFNIVPLPEEYDKYIKMLSSNSKTIAESKSNYENNKGSFFEYEFYADYLKTAIKNKPANHLDTLSLKNEVVTFLKQYPSSGYCMELFSFLFTPFKGKEYIESIKPLFANDEKFSEKMFNRLYKHEYLK